MSAIPGSGSLVMPELDPGIHPTKIYLFLISDGLPGQVVEDALRAFARQ
jgi:hypothetical protein